MGKSLGVFLKKWSLTLCLTKNIGKTLKECLEMEQNLPDSVNLDLRSKGLITENEVVLKTGDIYFAYDVISQNRRRIDVAHLLISEGSKRLLKG